MKFKNHPRPDSESGLSVSCLSKSSLGHKKPFALLAGRLYRLFCIALPLGASLQAQASGPLMPVHLRVGGREVTCKTMMLADDGETYVPLEALSAIGLDGKPDGKGEIAHVTQLTTHHSEDLAIARPNGISMLLLSDVARLVNAHVVRTEIMGRDNKPIAGSRGDTVYLLARVTDVRFQNGAVRVTTSFPVPYRAHMVTNEKVLQGLVECVGAEVPGDFHPAPPTSSSSDKSQSVKVKIRAQQYSIDTARVAIELPAGIVLKAQDKTTNPNAMIIAELAGTEKRVAGNSQKIKINKIVNTDKPAKAAAAEKVVRSVVSGATNTTTSGVSLNPGERVAVQSPGSPNSVNTKSSDNTAVGAIQTPMPPDDGTGDPALPDTAPKKPGVVVGNSGHTSLRPQSPSRGGSVKRNIPIEVSGLTLVPDTDTHVRLDIATSNAAGTFIHYLPGGKLAVDIPNAMLHLPEGINADQTLSHPLLNGIHAELLQDSPPLTRITCDTTRIVGFTVTNQSNKVSVDMRLPRNATGALADKVIVVDAGHGGSSTGATAGGFQEKNITLQIALKLREALEACGAKVVMTRDRDVDVDLSDCPNLANDIHADLFVSVHNDSFTSDCRGTSTYYHMSDPSSRALANIVSQTVAGVSGIPSKGALSDGILYNSGLAVLRQSKMPAILVEVAYISNTQDRRKLIDQDFQQRVANAICDGLRTYVEGGTQHGGRRMGMDIQEAPPIPGDTLENTKLLFRK